MEERFWLMTLDYFASFNLGERGKRVRLSIRERREEQEMGNQSVHGDTYFSLTSLSFLGGLGLEV